MAEGQFRFAGSLDPMQFQFRTGADVQLVKGLSIMPLGYVYTWNPSYGKQPNQFVNNEHRIFQQVTYKHHVGRLAFNHRARLEERFIQVHVRQNGETVSQGYHYTASRFRYRMTLSVPLNNEAIGPKTWFASAYDEIFFSWGPKVSYRESDQNRIFAGLGYQVDKKFTVMAGGFYQLLIKANGTMQENNVGLLASLTYNLDLTD